MWLSAPRAGSSCGWTALLTLGRYATGVAAVRPTRAMMAWMSFIVWLLCWLDDGSVVDGELFLEGREGIARVTI